MTASQIVVPTITTMGNTPYDTNSAIATLATQAAADINMLLTGGGSVGGNPAYKCAYLADVLPAYAGTGTATLTASATGLMGAQQGITPALGDVIFLAGGQSNTTAVNTGPWVITTLGAVGVKYVLKRPTWWANGGTAQYGQAIDVGPAGTTWANSSWKVMTAGSVIGTTDPQFYPRIQQVNLSAASGGVTPSSGNYNQLYIFGTNSQLDAALITVGGTTGNPRISTRTAGYPGTSAVVVTSTGGSDTSVYQVQVANW